MSNYNPTFNAFVGYALETGTITESTDGIVSPTMPAAPASFTLIGYTDVPEINQALNNGKGFGLGSPYALFDTRGSQRYPISINMRLGMAMFLANCLRNGTNALQNFCLYFGVSGGDLYAIRFCKNAEIRMNITGGDVSGGIITVSVTFEAIAVQKLGTSKTLSDADIAGLKAIGTLQWHDLRAVAIGGVNYRPIIRDLSVNVSHNLDRGADRCNFGDDNPLSRTSYFIIEQAETVGGTMATYGNLPPALFNGSKRAQSVGDIVFTVSDAPSFGDGTEYGFAMTLKDCIVTGQTQQASAPGTMLMSNVSFQASQMLMSVVST